MQDALNKHFKQSASSAANIGTDMAEFRGALALINERGRGACAHADALVDAVHATTGITYDEWVEYGRVLRDTWYYDQH
ncbi:MAG TPA: hypothetical protein VF803_01875, partial [Candidatus Paceibacterota bacterium]